MQLVVLNTGFDTTARDPDMVLARLMAAFMETHRGYRIARIVTEVLGEPAMAVVETSGSYEVLCVFEQPVAGGTLRSLVATLTREQAAASRNPLMAMFAYSPPCVFFTASEQQLLSEALAGFTDDTLSARLGIPLSAVKARWRLYVNQQGERGSLPNGERGLSAVTYAIYGPFRQRLRS